MPHSSWQDYLLEGGSHTSIQEGWGRLRSCELWVEDTEHNDYQTTTMSTPTTTTRTGTEKSASLGKKINLPGEGGGAPGTSQSNKRNNKRKKEKSTSATSISSSNVISWKRKSRGRVSKGEEGGRTSGRGGGVIVLSGTCDQWLYQCLCVCGCC